MSAVVKIGLGIFLGGVLLVAGCWACVGGAASSYVEQEGRIARQEASYADSVEVADLEVEPGGFGSSRATAIVTNNASVPLDVNVSFDLYEAGGVLTRSTPPDYARGVPPGGRVRVREEFFEHEGVDSVALGDVDVELPIELRYPEAFETDDG